MKRTTSRSGAEPTAGTLRGPLPVLLLALLVIGLAVPSGIAVAPALLGLDRPAGDPAARWQQAPTQLSGPGAGSPAVPLSQAAPMPVPAVLAAALDATLQSGGGSFTGVVQDALTGDVLFDRGGDQSRVPASNMKLFTAGAALQVLGPGERFTTRVLSGPTANSVVLRGGGDVLLAPGDSAPGAVLGRAGLGSLARAAVRTLQADGVTGPVAVLLDDSLFTGPALSPAWNPEDVAAGQIAPVYPIALNGARFDPAETAGPRPQDAAMTAAEAFAAQFTAAAGPAGITVTPGVARAPAAAGPPPAGSEPAGSEGSEPAGPRVLAEVASATVGEQVALMLRTSDNYLAEVLGRMTAVEGGGPGSNEGATAAVQAHLPELAPDAGTLGAADVSGLALGNKVTARQLAGVVREMTSGPDPRLRAALAGFPVAGLTGTLADRYLEGPAAPAAGLVRAKTGTLNTVMALSGYVVDADGRLLVFAFVGNAVSPGLESKAALDRSAAVLAGCGCR